MAPPFVAEIVYTVPLALWDIVPVVLAAAAWLTVATALAAFGTKLRAVAVVGALLVTFGGACKAGWKLVRAASDTDIPVVEDLLFPALASGFVLLAASMFARRVWRDDWVDVDLAGDRALALGAPIAVACLLVVAVGTSGDGFAEAAGRLLPIVVVASLAGVGMLIAWARNVADGPALGALVVHLVVTLGLGYLGSIDEQTTTLQWIEETSNVVNQGALLFAASRLAAARKRTATDAPAGVAA